MKRLAVISHSMVEIQQRRMMREHTLEHRLRRILDVTREILQTRGGHK